MAYLKQRHIVLWDPNGDSPRADWSVYKCLYAELDEDGDTYLLTAGKWYRIDRAFSRRVKSEVRKLVSPTPTLPDYAAGDSSETAYNARVAASDPQYALLDRKQILFGGGRSRFEFCDLLSTSREMVHVKRYGGSGPLSHLFAQGANAAQLWMTEPEFRKIVAKVLPPSHSIKNAANRPESDHYTLVYAIVSQSLKPIHESLPFFSCLTLKNAATSIRAVGLRVSLVKIQRQ